MKVNNINLINKRNVLNKYADKKLPQKIAYAITKNILIIEDALKAYEVNLEKIINSYEDYFIKNDNGENIELPIGIPKVDDEHVDNYIYEINQLLNIESDVDLYYIEESDFDYNESDRYDAVSAVDILSMRSVLCEK